MYKRYKDIIDFIVHWQAYIVVAEGEIRDNLAVYGIRIEFHLPVSTAMYLDRRLPILELKVWIGMGNRCIDVSSRAVMHEMWSHSESMKFNLLVNEMLRILINCSPYSVERRRCEARDILHEADAVIGFP